MTTVNLHSENAAVRVRAGVGMAGMFVVACFGAAIFFTSDQTQASESLSGGKTAPAQIAQTLDSE